MEKLKTNRQIESRWFMHCEHPSKGVFMVDREERSDGFADIEDRFANYNVYDPGGEKIGKVDDLFVDEDDQPEYIGVKIGLLGLRSTLIPWEAVSRVDDEDRRIEVSVDKETAKDGPTFDDDREITPDFEEEVYRYYGLQRATAATGERGTYGAYRSDTDTTGTERGARTDDSGDLDDQDELRVQRTEEELRAGTTEREAGRMNVRKRVRTDRESIVVPTKREEVHVERVPVDREASETEIGDDEISVPVTEEEVVVEKRPVVKEEIRIRKDVVEDEQVVEEDVRREEIDIDDATQRRTP